MSLSLKAALAASLETAINGALTYDPASQNRLAQIDQVLCVHFTLPELRLFFQVDGGRLQVSSYCEEQVATTLTGSPLALLKLLSTPTTSLAGSGVTLAGSTGLLQQWQTVLERLDIDWQAALDDVLGERFGDYVTPYLAKAMGSGVAYGKAQLQENTRLLREYLEHELQLLPNPDEVEYFFDEVRALALDVDRLEARLDSLEKGKQSLTKDGAGEQAG